ncbi:MAG: HAMP domain-containing sensor histidine kinase [Pseudobdellovibrio sp.]
MKTRSVRAYLEKSILKQSIVGFTVMAAISIAVSFFLARYKMASDLQEIAGASAKSFRSRILEGDIKSSEIQIHDLLQLKENEEFWILGKAFERIYKPALSQEIRVKRCDSIGLTCFDGYTGPARILQPIYFDLNGENLFGYLYISKEIQIDWIFVAMIFLIFSMGYSALLFGLNSIVKTSLDELGHEIEDWSLRLKSNPKDAAPLKTVPFSELQPLKESLDGLNAQITKFEKEAGHKAKLTLLRGIAHDILTPVAQLKMNFAVLENQLKDNASTQELMIEMSDSLKRASTIATQVKLLNSDYQNLPLADLNSVVENEIENLNKIADVTDKSIKLNFKTHTNGEFLSPLSHVEVSRILLNLIKNACHASTNGSNINIEIGKTNNNAFIKVTDFGSGIPFHLQNLVFEPEFTTKPSTGTGLGLSVVRHISEQRNGSVHLDSKPNKGTQITVSVPLRNDHAIQGGSHAT